MARGHHGAQWILIVILSLVSAMGLFPYIFMISTSLKSSAQFYHHYFGFVWPLDWSNYAFAWRAVNVYFGNTIYVAAVSIAGILLLSSVSAYVFAKHRFPAKDILFTSVIVLLLIPGITTIVPLFVLILHFGLVNTRWALIIPYIAGGQVLGIFLMRNFIENLPEELFDTAKMDGANSLQVYWKIVLPLSRPILGTVAMLNLIGIWNDYVWPNVVLNNNNLKTISVGLAFFQGQYVTQWGYLFAGYVIASIPLVVLFLFLMRYFVSGLTAGAIR